MNKLIILLIITVVAGCSTMGELRNADPVFKGASSKSPQNLSECILNNWQKQTSFDVFMQPNNGGYTVFLQGQWEIADVMKDGSGSSVRLYKQKTLYDGAYQKFIDWTKDCL
ncbi:hypothetical protein GBL96_10735 [Yersinia pseudotuberculosis]|nr:hypothetical protein [Yersinia pseudotuberculosis]MBO1635374.1 hypothetical protein [Yersinia pseudotuberculosis]